MADRVDREHLVEGRAERGEILDASRVQLDAAASDGSAVASASLADHHVRAIDTNDGATTRRGRGDRHTGAAADLEQAVAGLDVEEIHRPTAASHVRGAATHHPAGEVAERTMGVAELMGQ